ncbi:dynactin subunit 4 isoform X2 [Leptidea sinapis]|uniref:dynactin subunit 4 isoform X2 n=1 Tax=Leptidea sinapis TaxID=189913 RepID=UPI0021C40399|nr:dynactin subunit 4 isoform X2 [Leptidea sinapis]
MAYLVQPDYVKYICTCGQQKPITNLYFCRHCLKIRCSFCISHEVDSHYCANCLENMPSSEARLKKNRCGSCFDCPSCFHTLSTRATVAQPRQDPAAGDAKVENKQSKKMYYLLCFNCRWTSRDVGIPDQPVGGWPERVNPFNSRVNQLLDFYKAVVQQEKQEKLDKERKKYAIRGKYITLTDKTGLTMAMARNIAGLPSSEGAPSSAIANFVPSQASAEVEGLPDDFHTREVNLNLITTMPQRLAAPEWQPADVARLYPLARPLSVKRSQRCRLCDHNLTKPEYSPSSIKFKIELLAYYHVPEVKIISCETLKPGATCALLLKLSNPTAHEMQITLVDPAEVPEHQEREEGRTIEKSLEKSLCLEKDMSWLEAVSRKVDVTSPLSVTRPDVTLTLAQRDDAAEYDDDAHTHSDDVILWRKSNKLALRLQVQVAEGAVEGPGARLPLALRYSYRNTVPPASAAPLVRDHVLYVTVLLDLGQVYAE